jgi:hypothetical protein
LNGWAAAEPSPSNRVENINLEHSQMTPSIPKPTQTLKLKRQFDTPQLLRGGLYATWGITFALMVMSITGVMAQRQALKTVGKDAAPSILTAQQLKDSFADLDASLANELLSPPGQNQAALAQFEKNQKKIADRLVAAAKNITYSAEEPIVQSLQLNSSAYLLKLQAARDAHKRNDVVGALNIYRSAASLMDRKILPETDKLDLVNSLELESTYSNQNAIKWIIALFIALLGIGILTILGTTQIFLSNKMRRTFNVPLLGASAIAVVFLGYTTLSLISASYHLHVAKKDAFGSLHSLRQMRALSYMANADESRYLLDMANATQHDQSFKTKMGKVLTIPPTQSLDLTINNIQQWRSTTDKKDITELFADELNNVTFTGEKELAIETFKALQQYLAIDRQIRTLYQSGKAVEAITLCLGEQPGQSNWAFDRYKALHGKLMDLNEKEFNQNIASGNHWLDNFEIIAVLAMGSVATLTLFGLRPRLLEYL